MARPTIKQFINKLGIAGVEQITVNQGKGAGRYDL